MHYLSNFTPHCPTLFFQRRAIHEKECCWLQRCHDAPHLVLAGFRHCLGNLLGRAIFWEQITEDFSSEWDLRQAFRQPEYWQTWKWRGQATAGSRGFKCVEIPLNSPCSPGYRGQWRRCPSANQSIFPIYILMFKVMYIHIASLYVICYCNVKCTLSAQQDSHKIYSAVSGEIQFRVNSDLWRPIGAFWRCVRAQSVVIAQSCAFQHFLGCIVRQEMIRALSSIPKGWTYCY